MGGEQEKQDSRQTLWSQAEREKNWCEWLGDMGVASEGRKRGKGRSGEEGKEYWHDRDAGSHRGGLWEGRDCVREAGETPFTS